jgi:DNA polymerase-3 subunit delta'
MATEFVGNEHAIKMLDKLSRQGTIPHAWLFSGPPQVGKRTLAVRWAKWLNCRDPQPNLTPCETCPSCRHLDPDRPSYANTHPSVLIVDTWMAAYWEAVEKAKEGEVVDTTKLKPKLSIGVDAIRVMREQILLAPLARWQVFIVDEAERLTSEATAALLKALEEPPERTLFVLISANPWALSATVRSRCQPLRFGLVPTAVIASALQRRGVPTKEAEQIARLARGRIGWALQAGKEQAWREQREQMRTLLRMMATMTAWDASRFAELCSKGAEEERDEGRGTRDEEEEEKGTAVLSPMAMLRRPLEGRLEGLMLCWRDVLALALNAEDLLVNADWRDEMRQWNIPAERAIFTLRRLRQTLRQIRPPSNANPQLALEVLALDMAEQGTRGTGHGTK